MTLNLRLERIEAAIAGALSYAEYQPIALHPAVERYYRAARVEIPDFLPTRFGYRPSGPLPDDGGHVNDIDRWLAAQPRPAPLAGVQAELLRCGWHALSWGLPKAGALHQPDVDATCRHMGIVPADFGAWWDDWQGERIPALWRAKPVTDAQTLTLMRFGHAELELLEFGQ